MTIVRTLRWTACSMAVGGVGTVIYLRHASGMFRTSADIPSQLVMEQAKLQGVVADVTQGCRLRLDQVTACTPRTLYGWWPSAQRGGEWMQTLDAWLGLRGPGAQGVEVTLAGLTPSDAAARWLIHHTRHRHVWITLLRRDGNDLECHVHVKKGVTWSSVNKELVSLGLSTVTSESQGDTGFDTVTADGYNKLIHKLKKMEKRTERKTNLKTKILKQTDKILDKKTRLVEACKNLLTESENVLENNISKDENANEKANILKKMDTVSVARKPEQNQVQGVKERIENRKQRLEEQIAKLKKKVSLFTQSYKSIVVDQEPPSHTFNNQAKETGLDKNIKCNSNDKTDEEKA